MSDLKLTSQSIVLVEEKFQGKMPIGQFSGQVTNPFNNLANSQFLTALMKIVFGKKIIFSSPIKDENTPQRIFNFENNVQFIYDSFPPKFIAKYNTDAYNIDTIKKIFKEIIDDETTKSSIYAVGVNFEFFDSEDNIDTKNLLADKTKDGVLSTNISLQYNDMQITIADAVKDGVDGIYFNVNYHNIVEDCDNIIDIINKNLITQAVEKIESIIK